MIHQKILSFRPAFEIEVRGKILGTVKKKFSLLTPEYEIDYKGWHVEGMDLGYGYYVFSGSDIVIKITKELFDWGDTYVLDFNDPADELDFFSITAILRNRKSLAAFQFNNVSSRPS